MSKESVGENCFHTGWKVLCFYLFIFVSREIGLSCLFFLFYYFVYRDYSSRCRKPEQIHKDNDNQENIIVSLRQDDAISFEITIHPFFSESRNVLTTKNEGGSSLKHFRSSWFTFSEALGPCNFRIP